jgi:hypothetical protein
MYISFIFLHYYLYPQIIFIYMRFVFYIKMELFCIRGYILFSSGSGEVHEAEVTVGMEETASCSWPQLCGPWLHGPTPPDISAGSLHDQGPGQPLCQAFRQWLKS